MDQYTAVESFFPNDRRTEVLADLFRRARTSQVHVALIGDSQETIGGSYGGGMAVLMYMLNQATGTKIPGTPWMPPRARGACGGYYPCSHTAKSNAGTGTLDNTKLPPGFATYQIDVSSSDSGFGCVMMSDSLRVEHNIDVICQGATSLLTKDDTNWYVDVLAIGCDDANVHGGSAGNEVTVHGWKGSQTAIYFGGGSPAGTLVLTATSTSLGLETVALNEPGEIFTAGPIPFGAENYIGARVQGAAAAKVRIAAMRVYHRSEPGWFVHAMSEGGYRLLDASSFYASHDASGPFVRKMFSIARDERPDLTILCIGTNDIFGGKTAAAWKSELRTWLDWWPTMSGGASPVIVKVDAWRGDTSTSNYATYLVQYGLIADAIKELAEEGYPQLFMHNGLKVDVEYFGSRDYTFLSGKTHLGLFSFLVSSAGPTTITQNVHYVTTYKQGHFQHWLWTGPSTTIGTAGVITSTRHGPGGDMTIGAPVSGAPVDNWMPMMTQFGRQGTSGDGAPNDFVHHCPTGQQRTWQMFVNQLLGAIAGSRAARRDGL